MLNVVVVIASKVMVFARLFVCFVCSSFLFSVIFFLYLENPPETPNNARCPRDLPLLFFNGGDITLPGCGRVENRVDCPDGYECQIAPNGAFSFCCRSPG